MVSFVNKTLIGPVEAKKVAFGTVLSTEPFVISIFRLACHAPRRRKRGVVNDFCARETQIYLLSLIWKLGIYGNVNISVHAIMLCVARCMHYTAYVGVTKRGRGVVPIAPPTVR